MSGCDTLCASQVGDGAGKFQNSMIAARREVQPRDRVLEQLHPRSFGGGMLFDPLGVQLSIGFPLAGELTLACRRHACPYRLARLA